jgi:hypothetical protein
MTSLPKKRPSTTALLVTAALAMLLAGCGDDFDNEPREPVPIELTGVIQPAKVTVSPNKVGAGPISITISNQTDEAYTVLLEGASVREQVGPVNPRDTATIQKTVAQGTYTVRVAAEEGGAVSIRPAELKVGPPRKSSNDKVLLP